MFFLVLTGVMTLLAVYLGMRVIRPLPLSEWVRWVLFVAVVLCANKMVIFRYLVPGGFAPQVSWEILLVTGWLHTGMVLAALLCLCFDVVGIVFRRARVRLFSPRLRAVAVFGGGLILAVIGVQQAVKVPEVVTMDVAVPHLPPALNGFRIAHLTDLHLGALYGTEWAHELVARTNAAKPDLIVVVGDVVDGTPAQLAAPAAELAQLHAPYGVFLSVGNHEYYSGLEPWLETFSRLGLVPLLNRHVVIPVAGVPVAGVPGQTAESGRLVLAGVTDRVTLRGDMPGERTDVVAALRGAPPRDAATVRVLLDHQPAGAPDNANHVDLQLSGHTHGGLLLPLQKVVAAFNNGYVSGQYTVNGMRLVVSNGTGLWAGMPLRLGVPSQLLILRLVPAEA